MAKTLEQRLAEERLARLAPDGDERATRGAPMGNCWTTRSARAVPAGSWHLTRGRIEDEEPALVALDVGIDGAAASAEEAAMHVVDEDSLPG